jgi:nucleoside-triphosphatase
MDRFLNIFITGKPGVGKSTVVRRVMALMQDKGYKGGGVISPEIRKDGHRVGFEIVDLLEGRRGILSHVSLSYGPKIGRYRVNLESLSRIGVRAIERSVREADFIIIDEVGPMELRGEDFMDAVLKAAYGIKPVISVLHWRIRHPTMDALMTMDDVTIYEVTLKNRNGLPNKIVDHLLERARGGLSSSQVS